MADVTVTALQRHWDTDKPSTMLSAQDAIDQRTRSFILRVA